MPIIECELVAPCGCTPMGQGDCSINAGACEFPLLRRVAEAAEKVESGLWHESAVYDDVRQALYDALSAWKEARK